MEQKHILLSALSVGVGVGVGLGVNKWTSGGLEEGVTPAQIEQELLRLIVDGKDDKITLKEFPYYISEQTRVLLTSAAYVHLKHLDVSKHTRNLSPASRAILLSGQAEFYHQKLAKALSHDFEAKLLLLDIVDFSVKMQSKYGTSKKDSSVKRSISDMAMERMSTLLGSSTESTNYFPKHHRNASASSDTSAINSQCPSSSLGPNLQHHHLQVLVSFSETTGIILYIRDVERFLQSPRTYKLFDKMLKKLSGSTLVLGSRMLDPNNECGEVSEKIGCLFPYNIEIKPPEDEYHLIDWKEQLEENMKKIQFQDNKNHIAEVLAANDLECDDLGSICHADTMFISNYIEEIVVSAISYHLMSNKDPEYRNGKLGPEGEESVASNKNEAEKSVPPKAVIPANEIGVTFSDIGALDEIKESLQELVMLPLRRPDLFNGGLLKPCRGILLFGPPGTGKTMLAKAIANEAGASFINVSMSTITSKWFGEDEKNVRALFTLAAKVSPTIIFVDEVDSMLGQRTRVGEHEAMRKIKNEFMSHWDGLLTKPGERILVLAATNRPFDLDEAIIRRFERRIMVGLPSVDNRETILKTLLAKEKVEELDFKELAMMTEGYSGSDLKNLCVTAAYRPVRELMQQERQKDIDKKGSDEAKETKEESERVINLRPLNMEDMRQAKNQVAASFASEGCIMGELKQWNELYGEGGLRKKEQLSYFL
ncbi:AAA+ ATPase domain-containing protein [Cynara cardunculus var. scolymus]|uniref:AAA+ ATPase domain-containing protein n=1 Tax=Cynara cardunculus var. scolymus TaxID=59895 RepID=A0A103YDJ8_CYNCS|nr:AAA+ ATPase domain-containing protein [Cynara cardunculus var. scolymus]